MQIVFRRGTDDHLGALTGRGKGRGPLVDGQLPPALGTFDSDLAHGPQNGALFLVRCQLVQAGLAGQFDVDGKPVRQQSDALHQQRIGSGNGLGMDVAVEMVLLPQDAQRLDHQFHGAVGGAQHRTGQKQPLDVVAAVKTDGQVGQFPGREGGPGTVVGTPIDTVAAIVGAGVGVQHLEQRDAAPVGGKGMADAGGRAAAQTAVPPRTVHTAGGAGYVVFGTVGQDFQFFTQVHGIFLLKKGIKNTARRIGLSCKPCRGQHFSVNGIQKSRL